MKKVKRFVKELKRVKWPSGRESFDAFGTSIVFMTIAALILFGVAIALGILGSKIGVGF